MERAFFNNLCSIFRCSDNRTENRYNSSNVQNALLFFLIIVGIGAVIIFRRFTVSEIFDNLIFLIFRIMLVEVCLNLPDVFSNRFFLSVVSIFIVGTVHAGFRRKQYTLFGRSGF